MARCSACWASEEEQQLFTARSGEAVCASCIDGIEVDMRGHSPDEVGLGHCSFCARDGRRIITFFASTNYRRLLCYDCFLELLQMRRAQVTPAP